MIRRIRLYIAIILFLGFYSCLDLESEIRDVINPDIFPTNEKDAETLVTAAAYGPFRAYWGAMFSAGEDGYHVVGDMCTDVLNCKWEDNKWIPLNNVNFTPSTAACTKIYSNHINSISKMTMTLKRIADIPMNKATYERMKAELHCGRGWMAFLLFDFYGGIQIADLEQLEKPLANKIIPRKSTEETILFIEENLRIAANSEYLAFNYKGKDENYGRFTKGLAHMALLKLYMNLKQWDKAEIEARELMKPEYGYGLMEEYKDIFTLENEGNKEIVWAATCNHAVYANTQMWLSQILPSVYPTKNSNITKWDGYRMPWQFYNTFNKNRDKRLEVLIGEFTGTDGIKYNEENPGTPLNKGALPLKIGEDPRDTGNGSSIDWIVYRYADVLLSLSEILVRQTNAVSGEALGYLNQVRVRAGLRELETADYTDADEFLDILLLERGQELWGEGSRRSDLIRFGKFVEYAIKYNGSTTVQDYMTLMPLPQSIINEGRGAVIQNPGYK